MPAFFSGIWKYLAAGAVIVGGLVMAFLQIKQAGRDAERAEAEKRAANMRRVADEVENRVDAAGPAELGGLRDKWTRPE